MNKMQTRVFLLSLKLFWQQHPDLTKREIEKMAGEYLLNTVFSQLFGYDILEICREGKPYIKDCPYHFNLSHSGNWLLLAVGDTPVGADIEKITKIRPKTVEKYFSKTEQERVQKNGTEEFFEIWCQKESYVKYTGEGLKGLSHITEYPKELTFFSKKYEDYQISVCTRKDCLPQEIEIIT